MIVPEHAVKRGEAGLVSQPKRAQDIADRARAGHQQRADSEGCHRGAGASGKGVQIGPRAKR